MHTKSRLLNCLAFVLFIFSNQSQAVEIYSIYRAGCDRTVGAIVTVGDDAIEVLGLDGEVTRFSLDSIQLIARYDVLENPFVRIKASTPIFSVASGSSEGNFHAYPTGFIEDLVLFLDIDGKIRVVSMDEIISLRSTTSTFTTPDLEHRPLQLVSPPGRTLCEDLKSSADARSPSVLSATMLMSDKLKIDSFVQHMRTGYQTLEGLRERTIFYARPIFFDQKTRLGILFTEGGKLGEFKLVPTGWEGGPIYLQMGSGSAYRFQSTTSLGTRPWRLTPELRPLGGLSSEFKSHLLHGMFFANFDGFTAGKPLFLDSWDAFEDRQGVRKKPWMLSSLNHLTLLGADYGSWGISYGYYFPTFAIGQNHEFREVTSSRASPVFHGSYMNDSLRLEFFLFMTHLRNEGPSIVKYPTIDMRGEESDIRYFSPMHIPRVANLNSNSLRFDAECDLMTDIKVLGDLVFTDTRYRESSLRLKKSIEEDFSSDGVVEEMKGTSAESKLTSNLFGGRLGVHFDLGQWVALEAQAHFEHIVTKGSLGDEKEDSATDEIQSYIAVMELLL